VRSIHAKAATTGFQLFLDEASIVLADWANSIADAVNAE
jgi:hypothetical protein